MQRTLQTARNNALWCDVVCRAHGCPGEFTPDIWVTRRTAPRYYPNAVTLTQTGSATQIEHIAALCRAGIPGEWGVKDSFCTLELTPLGFRVLFEAQWIYRLASLPKPASGGTGVRWGKVRTAAALAEWEEAWRGDAADGDAIFLPALLDVTDVAVLAAHRGQQIVAGAIANRSDDVVGVSNIFLRASDGEVLRAGCVGAVMDAFPDLPLVGCESGAELTADL